MQQRQEPGQQPGNPDAAAPSVVPTAGGALPVGEFVALIALVISLAALSIDAMLPALPRIASDLNAADPNDAQLIVSLMFAGFALGQLIYGPLSDNIGRKPAIYAGIAIFSVGCLCSIAATHFSVMLLGRVLQGVGAAAPRIVSNALVRDQYKGASMARVMSLIMGIFIVVPAVAPAAGQAVMLWIHWRAIFAMLLVQALVAVVWLAARQPETLDSRLRRPFSPVAIARGAAEVCTNRIAMGNTITAGFTFGSLVGYLTSAQQIFVDLFGVGRDFPLYFGAIAVALGTASLLNSKVVVRFGMHKTAVVGLAGFCGLSLAFLALALAQPGPPSLWAFTGFMMAAFFCVGLVFGNLNAMAMEPLGHLAGTGAAVVGSLSTVVSLSLGAAIGQAYDQTVLPLLTGFAILGCLALAAMGWTGASNDEAAAQPAH